MLERKAKHEFERIVREENHVPSKVIVVESVRLLGRIAYENYEHTFEVMDDKSTLRYAGKAKMGTPG